MSVTAYVNRTSFLTNLISVIAGATGLPIGDGQAPDLGSAVKPDVYAIAYDITTSRPARPGVRSGMSMDIAHIQFSTFARARPHCQRAGDKVRMVISQRSGDHTSYLTSLDYLGTAAYPSVRCMTREVLTTSGPFAQDDDSFKYDLRFGFLLTLDPSVQP